MFGDLVVGIRKDLRRKWFVEAAQFCDVKKHVPIVSIHGLKTLKVDVVAPFQALNIYMLNLGIDELMLNLSQSWKVLVGIFKHNQDHSSF